MIRPLCSQWGHNVLTDVRHGIRWRRRRSTAAMHWWTTLCWCVWWVWRGVPNMDSKMGLININFTRSYVIKCNFTRWKMVMNCWRGSHFIWYLMLFSSVVHPTINYPQKITVHGCYLKKKQMVGLLLGSIVFPKWCQWEHCNCFKPNRWCHRPWKAVDEATRSGLAGSSGLQCLHILVIIPLDLDEYPFISKKFHHI